MSCSRCSPPLRSGHLSSTLTSAKRPAAGGSRVPLGPGPPAGTSPCTLPSTTTGAWYAWSCTDLRLGE